MRNLALTTLLVFIATIAGVVAAKEQCSYHFAEVGQKTEGEYSGECKNGKADGHGIVSYDNGATRSEGEYRNGLRHGHSITVWANGDRYEGEYRGGKQHGQGTFKWANGNAYSGEFRDGILEGEGIFVWSSGDRYVGKFRDDAMNGHGTHYSKAGDRQVGYWENGLLWKGWVYGANGAACEIRAHKSIEPGCVEFD